MAYPTAVNNQITDASIPPSHVSADQGQTMTPDTPFESMAHSAGTLFQNAIASQQHNGALMQAAATMGSLEALKTGMMSLSALLTAQNSLAKNLLGMLDASGQKNSRPF